MANELATFFTSLGFKVDPSGAELFENQLRGLRANSALLARNLGVVADKLDVVRKKAIALNSVMNKDNKVVNSKGTTAAYSRMDKYVEGVAKAQTKLTEQSPKLIEQLDKLRANVWKTSNAWDAYSKSIRAAKEDMKGFREIAGMGRTGRVTVNNRVYGSSQSSVAPRPTINVQNSGAQQAGMYAMIGGGIREFLRSMTPATAIAGGLVTAGHITKEVVTTGREMMKMNNILLMASKDTTQYGEALEFVRKQSNTLGQDVQETGMAFAKMMQSGRGKVKFEDLQKTFTGFGELMVAMGSSTDDQKGIYRALTQMMTKGKIEAEEEGQMAERGLPAKELIKQAAMKHYGVDNAGYESMRKKGKVKIEDIMVELASDMSKLARNNDALDKMLNTSAVQQARLKNRWKEFTQEIMEGGLDQALSAMFKSLTALIDVLTPFLKGLGIAAKGVYDLAAAIAKLYYDNARVAGILTSVAALLVVLKVNLFSATAATYALGGGAAALIARYGILALRIAKVTAVAWLLFEAFSALSRANDGELNWVTRLGVEFQVLYSEIDVALAKFEEFAATAAYYAKNPVEIFKSKDSQYQYNPEPSSFQEWLKNKTIKKELEKTQPSAPRYGDVPIYPQNTTSMSLPTIRNQIYLNGDLIGEGTTNEFGNLAFNV